MSVVVVGLGYVGVTGAACLASQGHRVWGVDVNPDKVSAVAAGRSPITEPMVGDLLADANAAGRLGASDRLPDLSDVDLVVVCVGTPSAPDGSHNMSFVAESTRQVAQAIRASERSSRITVTYRSTFKPGTMDGLIAPLFEDALGADFAEIVELAYNPEFLRESTAVSDYFNPPKIVVGTRGGVSSPTMERLHEGIDAPVFEIDIREAEITKFIDNSWHATKVAFANEFGRVCAAYGVDASVAHEVFVSDTKLNVSPVYLRPGGAFGGSCLPKDVRAMHHIATSAGVEAGLLGSLVASNESHKAFQLRRVLAAVNEGSRILVAGLAFKAGTDDMRESPNVDLVASLLESGYNVRVFDPSIETIALVGQNLGHVVAAIPRLREILISPDSVRSEDFDLVVITNATGSLLPELQVPVLDLRVITS